MKILLIEDDPNKEAQLSNFIKDKIIDSEVYIRKSYQSGLKFLMEEGCDLVILDMSLPTYDISSNENGYKFRKLGGLDILGEIKRKRLGYNVLIVTQFETFGDESSMINLNQLKLKLYKDYPDNYKGTVYYNASQSAWKGNLLELINKIN
ncbi:MAG: response regulator [Bacteroidetes bacterium]|nr:response regulator [Bacteroidota bacterium]